MKKIFSVVITIVLIFCTAGCNKNEGKLTELVIGNPDGEALTPKAITEGFIAEYPQYSVKFDETSWFPFMAATGAEPFGAELNKSNLKDKKVKEAMLHYKKGVDMGITPDQAWVAENGSRELAFAQGKIGMYVCQSSGLKTINSNCPEGFRYDAQIMPVGWSGERKCVYVPNVWVMYTGAPDDVKDAAWEWIKYYMSEKSQMIIAQEGKAGYPVMKSALDMVSKNGLKPEHKDVFFKGIDDYGVTILENPVSEAVNMTMQEMFGKIYRKEVTDVDSLIEEYDKLLQEEFDYYYDQSK